MLIYFQKLPYFWSMLIAIADIFLIINYIYMDVYNNNNNIWLTCLLVGLIDTLLYMNNLAMLLSCYFSWYL